MKLSDIYWLSSKQSKVENDRLSFHNRQLALLGITAGLQVYPIGWMEKGKMLEQNGKLYVSYDDMYKIIFIDHDISEERLKFAFDYATKRIHEKIEALANKHLKKRK